MLMTNVPKVTPDQLKAMLRNQSCLLVDVREPEEFSGFHIAGSISLPLTELARSGLAVPGSCTAVITICARGYRSGEAAKRLIRSGISNVHSLEGGLQAWQESSASIAVCPAVAGFDRPRSILFGMAHVVFAGLTLSLSPQWVLGNLALGAGMILNGLTGWCGLSLWFRNPNR